MFGLNFLQEICPYCFEPFKLAQTPFRCASPPTQCPPEVDPVFAKAWNQPLPIGKVIPAESRSISKMRCPQCQQVSWKRLCPTCHADLPRTIGEYESLIFSIIGAKEAGKSHYLAVLIDEILKNVGPGLQLLLEPLNEYTIKRYRDDFHTPVFRKKAVIQATTSASADRNVMMPLIYSLACSGKRLFGGRKIKKVVTLAFFDTAGEDLNNQDTMSVLNKYIYRSQGIILLLDPLQLPPVRDRLGGTVPLPEQNSETIDIIGRVTNLIQAGKKLGHSAQIPIPLAVAFSKFDAVTPLVDPQFQLLSTSNHDTGFDVGDFNAINSEMRSLVAEWEGQPLLNQVTTRYKYHGFFGLSALGCNPHGSNTIPHVLPKRVEDPFLWLLYHHGIVKAAARK